MLHVARRLLLTIPLLFGVATLSFLLIHFVPGDPVDIMLGDQASVHDKTALRHDLDLDRPVAQQYFDYLGRLAHFDLGRSVFNHRPIAQEMGERIGPTLQLTFGAMLIAIVLGIPLGVVAAVTRRAWLRSTLHFSGLLGISVPSFWLAPMLTWIFALRLNWLPVSENGSWLHLVLPAMSLGLALACILMHTTQASLENVLHEDYIRVARAKGVSPLSLYGHHALKNAATPIITTLGLQFGALLSGTVITETIFDWPGIGLYLFQGIQQRNYSTVQGCVLLIALIYVSVTLLTDIAYTIVDPRLRLE